MVQYRDRTFSKFDPAQPLVAKRQMTLLGNEIKRGDALTAVRDDAGNPIPTETARRLWMTHYADYKADFTPTPELTTQGEGLEWMDEDRGVTVEQGDNGWYTVKAAWLNGGEGEKVRGAEAAEARAAEVRDFGDTKGVTYTATGGGWYSIAAPWLADPIKAQGEANAVKKVRELIDGHAGEPETPAEPPAPAGGGGTTEQPEQPADPAPGSTDPAPAEQPAGAAPAADPAPAPAGTQQGDAGAANQTPAQGEQPAPEGVVPGPTAASPDGGSAPAAQ